MVAFCQLCLLKKWWWWWTRRMLWIVVDGGSFKRMVDDQEQCQRVNVFFCYRFTTVVTSQYYNCLQILTRCSKINFPNNVYFRFLIFSKLTILHHLVTYLSNDPCTTEIVRWWRVTNWYSVLVFCIDLLIILYIIITLRIYFITLPQKRSIVLR